MKPPAYTLIFPIVRRLKMLTLLLSAFLLTLNAAQAQRGEDFTRLLTPVRGRPPIIFDYQFRFYPSASVRSDESSWRQHENEISFHMPLAGGRGHVWSGGFRYHHFDISTDAALPQTPEAGMPSELAEVDLNISYQRLFENQHYLGVTGKLGSASDQLFHSRRETDLTLLGIWQIPAEDNRSWFIFLSYASRAPALGLDHVPLPGFAHLWLTDEGDWYMLGIPASALRVEALPGTYLNLFYLPVRNVSASITWEAHKDLTLYTAFNWENNRFWRAAREDSDQSLNIHQAKLSIGSRWSIMENLSLSAKTGKVFERSVYEAKRYSQRRDNRLQIADGWFAELKAEWRF